MEELLDDAVKELAVDGTVKESVVDSMAKQLVVDGALEESEVDATGRDAERCVLSAGGTKIETSLMNSCRGPGLNSTQCQSILPPVLTAC